MNMTVSESDFQKKSTFSLFTAYYRPNRKLFLLDMICAFLIAGIDLSFPMISRYALQIYLPDKNYRVFFSVVAGIFAAFILRAFMQYIVNYWGHIMGANIEMLMRRDLFSHLQKLSFSFYDNRRTGNLMSRILTDLFDITELSHHGPEDLFISVITLIGSFAALLLINVQLALVLIISLPVLLLFTIFLRNKMSAAAKHLKKSTASINEDIESSISGARVAKAFANEDYESDKFMHGSLLFKSARAGFYRVMALFLSGMEFMICMLSLISIGFGGYLIMQDRMTVIDLVAFTMYISAFLTPIRKLTNFTELYQSGMAGFSRFVELMKEEPDIINRKDAITLTDVKGEVSFNHVTFSYSNEETADKVLSDINLLIPAGKTIAVVGPSGGGKTTLCHLIPRFYEVQAGEIRLDGMDIRDIEIRSLRKNIGIVQQDVFLFATSIMGNIRYGNLNATDEEVMQAAKSAELDEFVRSLPEGYNTYVGERGLLLSGGQKQRISIARVFLKNPPVLLLDEATSALDTQTEQRIQHALERLSKGRTCIVIAHRLSTIRNADEIIYLNENGIAERGTHDDLLKRKGPYSELYHIQFADLSGS